MNASVISDKSWMTSNATAAMKHNNAGEIEEFNAIV